jgi:hypothetical protein
VRPTHRRRTRRPPSWACRPARWATRSPTSTSTACALLDLIGSGDPDQPTEAQVDLREHRRALMGALDVVLLVADAVEEADAVDAERAKRDELRSARPQPRAGSRWASSPRPSKTKWTPWRSGREPRDERRSRDLVSALPVPTRADARAQVSTAAGRRHPKGPPPFYDQDLSSLSSRLWTATDSSGESRP